MLNYGYNKVNSIKREFYLGIKISIDYIRLLIKVTF